MSLWLLPFDTLDTRTTRERGGGHCRAPGLDGARTLCSTSGQGDGLAAASTVRTLGQPQICKILNRVCLFINKCSSWMGIQRSNPKNDSRARQQLLEPEGTEHQGGRWARLTPTRCGKDPERCTPQQSRLSWVSCFVQVSLGKYVSGFFAIKVNLSPMGILKKMCITVEFYSYNLTC